MTSVAFENGREAFNTLSPMPGTIDLGDDRELCITAWEPSAKEPNTGSVYLLPVSLKGFIRLKKEETKAEP